MNSARTQPPAAPGPPESAQPSTDEGVRLSLNEVGCPIAVCSLTGRVLGMSPSARILLKRAMVDCEGRAPELPPGMWRKLLSTPLGQSIDWRPEAHPGLCVGVSRYRMEHQAFLLLMREITDSKETMARRMQQQRLEAIGRLIAGIAHDLRAPLASIVFSVSVLSDRCEGLTTAELREKLEQIRQAAERQQSTIAGLLDFAKVGPPVNAPLSVDDTFKRVTALLRPKLREHGIQVSFEVSDGAGEVHGNPLTIEQILVNLVLNAAETAGTRRITLSATSREDSASVVDLHVADDGPGVPAELAERIFDPFFTTKGEGTGIGLTTARDAAVELGGDLLLLPSDTGAHFVLRLQTPDRGGRVAS